MELGALAQLEDPLGLVGVVNLPFGRQTRNQVRRLVRRRQVPVHQRIIDGIAHEPLALAALVGLARRQRDIRQCHADPESTLGTGDTRRHQRRRYR